MTPPSRRQGPSFASEWVGRAGHDDAPARAKHEAKSRPTAKPAAVPAPASAPAATPAVDRASGSGAPAGEDAGARVWPNARQLLISRSWADWIARLPELYVALGIMVVATGIYLFTTAREATNFDYFNRLADAFLHGRIYLTQGPPHALTWLNELIPATNVACPAGATPPCGWYVAYPPMPAVLVMPFVAVFGTGFHQQIAASICGGIAVGLMYLVLGHFSLSAAARWMLTAVFGFGTVLWFCSETGSAWLFSQSAAVMFATAAVLPAIGKHKRPFLAGLLLGCATISRLPVGLTAPFYLAVILELGWPPKIPVNRWAAFATSVLFVMGLFLPEALNMLYNMARYNSPIDQSYTLIPGILQDRYYKDHGILSIYYIPRELYAIFFRSWNFVEEAPFFKPSWYGLSLFLTTPLFLWLAKGNWRDRRVVYAWAGIALALIPIITHGNVGLTQFGYRFSLDFQIPMFVILATVFERGVSKAAWAAAALAILTNLYGVWTIGMGFVSF